MFTYLDPSVRARLIAQGKLIRFNARGETMAPNQGITDITPVKHVVGVGRWNQRYLAAKRDWGHRLDDQDIEPKP